LFAKGFMSSLISAGALFFMMVSGPGGCGAIPANPTQTISGFGLKAAYDADCDRLTYFGPNKGPNLLFAPNRAKVGSDPEDGYVFFGGMYSWIGPQGEWVDASGNPKSWPPDPVIDRGPMSVMDMTLREFQAVGPVSPISGLRESKSVEIVGEGEAVVTHRVENLSDEPRRVSIWTITAAPTRAIIVVPRPLATQPIGMDKPESHDLWERRAGEVGNWVMLPRQRMRRLRRMSGELKAFVPVGARIDAQQHSETLPPCIAIWKRHYWLLRVGDPSSIDVDGTLWAAGEAPVEVYVNSGLKIFEAELLSPIVELQPGESTQFTERWFVIYGSRYNTSVLDKALAKLGYEIPTDPVVIPAPIVEPMIIPAPTIEPVIVEEVEQDVLQPVAYEITEQEMERIEEEQAAPETVEEMLTEVKELAELVQEYQETESTAVREVVTEEEPAIDVDDPAPIPQK